MNSKAILKILFITSFMISFSQSSESHKYETLFSEDNFEVRNYEPVLKAKLTQEKALMIILVSSLDIFVVTMRRIKKFL